MPVPASRRDLPTRCGKVFGPTVDGLAYSDADQPPVEIRREMALKPVGQVAGEQFAGRVVVEYLVQVPVVQRRADVVAQGFKFGEVVDESGRGQTLAFHSDLYAVVLTV